MYLIDDKPFIDLTSEIDIDDLRTIEYDIAYGLAKSKNFFWDVGPYVNNRYDTTLPSIATVPLTMKDVEHPYHEYFKKLNFNSVECQTFAKFAGSYQGMGYGLWLRAFDKQKIDLTKVGFMQHKANPDVHIDSPCYAHFPSLRKWIDNIPIFDKIGRIIFFLNAPGEIHSLHKDSYVGHVDSFILLNINQHKKTVFIFDDETKEKYTVTDACVFDTRQWHGSTCNNCSWTLRIDGKFNYDWAKSKNLESYFFKKEELEGKRNASN